MAKFKDVDEYISSFDGITAERLAQTRRVVLEEAPEAEERISYNMPALRQGKNLLYYAGYAHHIGFYALPSGNEAFREQLKNFKTGKGSIQFSHDQPLPEELIRQIVRFRLEEVAAKM